MAAVVVHSATDIHSEAAQGWQRSDHVAQGRSLGRHNHGDGDSDRDDRWRAPGGGGDGDPALPPTSPAPEPPEWAMLILGAGALGLWLRRRLSSTTSAL
jgi:hypothetical protein